MASCLVGSGTIGKRMLLLRQSTLHACNNTGISTSHVLITGRSATTKKSVLPRINQRTQLQQRVFMSTGPSSSPFENIGIEGSRVTTNQLSPSDQLLTSIESHQPKRQILSEKAFTKLEQLLHHSYTVPQLRKYLSYRNITPLKKYKKAELIQLIMETDWKLTTAERKRTKELLERKNTSQQQFKLENDEMFFVLDNNGSMLKTIEESYTGIRIMINMTGRVGTVEGPKRHLASAMAAIRDALVLERQSFKLGNNTPSSTYLSMMPQQMMDDLSKSSGAYISVENDMISLTAPSSEALNDAKRKLAVFLTDFGLTSKPSLQSSDYTVIQKQPLSTFTGSPLTFLPLHDSPAMPLAMKTIGWSRISDNEAIAREEDLSSQFQLLERGSASSSSILSPLDLKDILRQSFMKDASKSRQIGIEATFGHLLFQNPTMVPGQTNLIVPELRGNFDVSQLQNLFSTSTSHRRFFSGSPPKSIRPSLVPVASNDDFHQRTITVNYIESSLLGQFESGVAPSTTDSSLQRVQLEFIELEDGELEFKRAIGEHGRSAMDIIGLAGNVDIRLTAKEYTLLDKNSSDSTLLKALLNLAAKCRLTSYSEVMCPSTWKSECGEMTLLDIAFNNESRYELNDNLVTLRYIEEQESRTRRAEMKLEPSDSYHSVANGFDSWDNLWCNLVNLAKRWHYRGD